MEENRRITFGYEEAFITDWVPMDVCRTTVEELTDAPVAQDTNDMFGPSVLAKPNVGVND